MNRQLSETVNMHTLLEHVRQLGTLGFHLWRSFHCSCCRDIWSFIADARSRHAVNVADEYARGLVCMSHLRDAHNNAQAADEEAWDAVQALRLPEEPNRWVWPVSEEVDQAWVRYCAVGAAKECSLPRDDEILLTTTPDAAASVRPWAMARTEVLKERPWAKGNDLWPLVIARWAQLYQVEQDRQVGVLRKLVASNVHLMNLSAGEDVP